jgi:hypothetical protein
MIRFPRTLGGVIPVLVVIWTVSGPPAAADKKEPVWKPVLSAEDSKELVARAKSIVQREISNLNPGARDFKKRLRKIHTTAVFLAVYVQADPQIGKDRTLAALRDTAVQLSQKVGDKPDVAAAKKLADDLGDPKPGIKTKVGAVSLRHFVGKRDRLMYAFRTVQLGGDGIDPQLQDSDALKGERGNGVEKKIQALAAEALSPEALKKQSEELSLMASKVAAISQLVLDWTPNVKKEGRRTPQKWSGFARDMRKAALELATIAKKGTPKEVRAKAGKLNAVCTKCHTIFK